jgi:hypothetical protein
VAGMRRKVVFPQMNKNCERLWVLDHDMSQLSFSSGARDIPYDKCCWALAL